MVVVCGWTVSLGIRSSTKTAQPLDCGSVPNTRLSRSARRPETPPASRRTGGEVAASYSRFSSDNQDSSSIDQQRRKCRERATADGNDLRSQFEFADEAASGTRSDRDGFNAMLKAARAGEFKVLYLESLSRLARELVLSIATLKELVYVHGIRVISTSEGLDSDQAGWEFMAIFRSWMHGEFLAALRSAVSRGMEEAVLNDYSVGDWCLGYGSAPLPTPAGVRHAKPRRQVVINEEHAAVVRNVFHRFVVDRIPLAQLAKELTRAKAPKDHRATTDEWRHASVVDLLRNQKYIGIWPWGLRSNVRHPLTGKVRQVCRPPEEAAQFERERPYLRLVEDELFFKAQGLLDENEARTKATRKPNGQLRGATRDSQNPRHLLQGLIKCGACGATFQVTGSNGLYLACRGYATGACQVKTRLPRALTAQRLLEAVGARILRDGSWRAAVVAATATAWEDCQRGRPEKARILLQQLSAVEKKLAQLVDAIEDGVDDPEVRVRLALRRRERDDLKRSLAEAQATEEQSQARPTSEWVAAQLERLWEVLQGAGPAAAVALRHLIGPVFVTEVLTEGKKRKHFRATFTIRAAGGGAEMAIGPEAGPIDVDLGQPPSWAAHVETVKAMFDDNMKFKSIAKNLKISRTSVAQAFAAWHRVRGLEPPDGRAMVGRLRPAKVKGLADRAKELWDRGLLITVIATQLGERRSTVAAAIRHWFESRGDVMPDGRTRRETLETKVAPARDEAGPESTGQDSGEQTK